MSGITAHCTNCEDAHGVGDRSAVPGTTACPSCGDTPYRTVSSDIDPPEPDVDRILDAIRDVDGVGGDTLERVVHRYDRYVELESATVDELAEIKNVGTTVAERMVEATQ